MLSTMAPVLGIEPSQTASKAIPAPSGHRIEWYGRWDSNPRTHGLNVRDMPLSYARVLVAMEGIEPSRPKRLVYSEPLIHTGLHRQEWCSRQVSNLL